MTITHPATLNRDELVSSFQHMNVELRTDGIHVLHFRDMRKAVIDEWYDYQSYLNIVTPCEGNLLQMLVIHDEMPPITYMLQKTRALYVQFPVMPRHSAAIVYPMRHSILIQASMSMLNTIPDARQTSRFFLESKSSEALTWLLSRQ